MSPELKPVGDSALLVEFDNRIGADVNDSVLALTSAIAAADINGVAELVPSYRSLLIHYDCLALSLADLSAKIGTLINCKTAGATSPRRWQIPVHYGGEAGCDLNAVAELHQLTCDEVIRLHSQPCYRVYLIGFAPGWCYLGGLDQRLHTPRRPQPRPAVPAGCIPIGGQQALIGALPMPSGWHLLGQTPVRTFDPNRPQPFFITPGDQIVFKSISAAEYARLAKHAAKGEIVAEQMTVVDGDG